MLNRSSLRAQLEPCEAIQGGRDQPGLPRDFVAAMTIEAGRMTMRAGQVDD